MKIDPQTGWLDEARIEPSPNIDERPADTVVDTLIIHNISLPPDQYGGNEITDFFCNKLDCDAHPFFEEIRDVRVSSHFLIRRDGEIIQFAPVQKRAWHAGVSVCGGRERVNDFSVGIELEGSDHIAYEDVQYRQLAALTAALGELYPDITPARIFGHSDIAPGRKTDPGESFDWDYYRALLARAFHKISGLDA